MLKKYSYFLCSNFIFFYFTKLSVLFLNFNYFSIQKKLIYKVYLNFINFYKVSFKFFNYFNYFLFKQILYSFTNRIFGCYTRLTLQGIGLIFEIYSDYLYKFCFSSSHNVYLYLPKEFILKFSNTSEFIVFSVFRDRLNNFISSLFLMDRFGVYSVKGLKLAYGIVFLKEGKKR